MARPSQGRFRMYTVDEAVEFLLNKGTFSCGELAQVLGVSRQAALRHLKRRVASGQLELAGCARGTRYRMGPGTLYPTGGAFRGLRVPEFWAEVAKITPGLCYVRAAQTIGFQLRTRKEARRVLEGLREAKFLIVDFEGVLHVTEAFANEMFVRWLADEYPRPRIQAINASTAISKLIDRLQRIDELKPKSDYGT